MNATSHLKSHIQDSAAPKTGLPYWMSRVLQEHAKASKNLSGDPIHDLRTALRRCLTIESAMSELDPHPAWKKLRRTGKKLMKGLGSLRDSEVLLGWLSKFENANRTVGQALETSLQLEFDLAKKEAQGALKSFGREKWAILQKLLVERAARLIPETAPAQYLALERWDEAYKKHRFALRSRSKISYHRARAGLKTFRYTLENFMPGLHAKWRGDVKQLQDMLGEVHDLDVLWTKIVALRPAQNDAAGMEWKTAIESERMFRLAQYRTKTRGKNSIWQAWRAALPHGDAQEEAALAKLSVWSAYRTPEFTRAERVATLSAELYDLLAARGFTVGLPTERGRVILRAAALLEDVGRMSGNKGHHKESYRLIHKLPLPLGWRPSELQLVALVARYHRKALPQLKHKEFSSLSSSFRQATLLLAGILRLAICCEQSPIQIRRMDLEVTLDGLLIRAYGFDGEEPLLSKLATAKHLLEIACRRPIAILPGVAGTPVRTSDLKTKTAAA